VATGVRGKAVQVDPTKPTLKAHGTKRLKLKFALLLSNFAFKFNLRRYDEEVEDAVEVLYADRADFVQHNSTTTAGASTPHLRFGVWGLGFRV